MAIAMAAVVVVQAEHVTKRFGKVEALRGVSFSLEAGRSLALWGPNGAGKTTLIKAILGLIDYRGVITVEGVDARRAGKRVRGKIGYVPQEAVYYDWSVLATMTFYARLKKADRAAIPALLDRLGLAEHLRKPVPALSGGLKQRLALAIALLGNPPVLLLDEPMANLDAQARHDYLALLSGLRREGRSLVFASHRVEEVEALADQVLVLQGGRVATALQPGALRAWLQPEVDLALWVPEAQRSEALAHLAQLGMAARLNGRGTVVARVPADKKGQPLNALTQHGIPVLDFEVESHGMETLMSSLLPLAAWALLLTSDI